MSVNKADVCPLECKGRRIHTCVNKADVYILENKQDRCIHLIVNKTGVYTLKCKQSRCIRSSVIKKTGVNIY